MSAPYYEQDGIVLYHGDCLEQTAWLDAGVLVTDPPYGIAWTRHGVSRTSRANRAASNYDGAEREAHLGIKNDQDTEARDEVLAKWGDKPAFVFGSMMMPPPAKTRLVAGYVKPLDSGALSGVASLRRDLEAIYVLGKSDTWTPGGRHTSVFRTGARVVGTPSGLARRYGHPHAKPVDVLESLIQLAPGIVAEPFAGSGSTLVAARNLGRKAIGVELEERYCEIIATRLSQGALDFGGAS